MAIGIVKIYLCMSRYEQRLVSRKRVNAHTEPEANGERVARSARVILIGDDAACVRHERHAHAVQPIRARCFSTPNVEHKQVVVRST